MKVVLSVISPRRGGVSGPAGELVGHYVERAGRYLLCESRVYPSEEKLLGSLDEAAGRTRPFLLLTDSFGKRLTSEELAAAVGGAMDAGTQMLVVAVGPADGWSEAARKRADLSISFGKITLPHELAAVIAAEQLYRALTIRAGHPYHSGH